MNDRLKTTTPRVGGRPEGVEGKEISAGLARHVLDIARAIQTMPKDPVHPTRQPRAIVVGSYALTQDPHSRDVDFEIHGVSATHLAANITAHPPLAAKIASVELGGNAYVVAFAKLEGGYSVNFSVPIREGDDPKRYDTSSVIQDPTLSFADSILRRDFTINAVGFDPISNEHLDPLGGIQDQLEKILRPVNPNFHRDPTRLPRTLRLLAEGDFTPTKELEAILYNMALHPGDLSASNFQLDRYLYEITRMLVSSAAPSTCLGLAKKYGLLAVDFPQLEILSGVNVGEESATVWDRTLALLDREHTYSKERLLPESEAIAIQIGVLHAGVCKAYAITFPGQARDADLDLAGLTRRIAYSEIREEAFQLGRATSERIQREWES